MPRASKPLDLGQLPNQNLSVLEKQLLDGNFDNVYYLQWLVDEWDMGEFSNRVMNTLFAYCNDGMRQGNSNAYFLAGLIKHIIKIDKTTALADKADWYFREAIKIDNNRYALMGLGELYLYGVGCDKDFDRGVELFTLSIKSGKFLKHHIF